MKYLLLLIAPLLCMGAASVNNTNVVPNLSVLTNAYVGGFASLSGTTNRLTVASGQLKLDGTPIISNIQWTNYSVADVEGGTVYGSYSINTLSDGVVAYGVNYLTNFWGDPGAGWFATLPAVDSGDLLRRNVNLYGVGTSVFDGALITNCFDIYAFGEYSFKDATIVSSGSLFTHGFQAFKDSYLTNCNDISALSGGFEGAQATNSSSLWSFGYNAMGSQMSKVTHSFAIGERAMGNLSYYTNCVDLWAIGTDTLQGNFADKSHIFVIGTGAKATNSNDFVIGDAAYKYYFPGTSAEFSGGPMRFKGVTDAGNAAAGYNGEINSSAVAAGSAVSLTTATPANITSISLTAGDWDVEGNINFTRTGATITATAGGISTTTATLPTDGTQVHTGTLTTTANLTDGLTLPRKRISISGTTTVYLVASTSFSAGSSAGYGSISARRVR